MKHMHADNMNDQDPSKRRTETKQRLKQASNYAKQVLTQAGAHSSRTFKTHAQQALATVKDNVKGNETALAAGGVALGGVVVSGVLLRRCKANLEHFRQMFRISQHMAILGQKSLMSLNDLCQKLRKPNFTIPRNIASVIYPKTFFDVLEYGVKDTNVQMNAERMSLESMFQSEKASNILSSMKAYRLAVNPMKNNYINFEYSDSQDRRMLFEIVYNGEELSANDIDKEINFKNRIRIIHPLFALMQICVIRNLSIPESFAAELQKSFALAYIQYLKTTYDENGIVDTELEIIHGKPRDT